MKLKIFITLLILTFISINSYAQEIEIKTEEVKELLPSYSHNLKQLIREAERHLKNLNKDIKEREILKKNQEKEKVVREYFEKGTALRQEGKIEEAKKEWENVLNITKDPGMEEYIHNSEKITGEKRILNERKKREELFLLKQKASKLYKEGLSLYHYKKYKGAFEKFTDAQNLIPGYAKTEHFLNRISRDINRGKISSLCKEAVGFYDNGELDQAEEIFKIIISFDHAHVKAKKYLEYLIPRKRKELEYIPQSKEKIRKEKKVNIKKDSVKEKESIKKVDDLYKEALSLYKNKDYEVSRRKFQDLQDLSPDYSRTEYYLKRLPKDIDKHTDWLERQKEQQINEIILEIERKRARKKQE